MLALTTCIGLVNGLGVVLLRVHPLIMTLAMATFLQGLLIIIAGGSAVTASNPLVIWLGNARPVGIPAGVLLWIVVSRWRAARCCTRRRRRPHLRHRHQSARQPRCPASPSRRPRCRGLRASAASRSGLAGCCVLGMNRQGYVGIGDPYLLASIAAVVLGGTSILGGRGTYAGTIAGAILLVTITALITVVNASPGWRSILFGSLILGCCCCQAGSRPADDASSSR